MPALAPLGLTLAPLGLAPASLGSVLTVDDSGGAAFASIDAALAAAVDGDVVLVASGVYGGFTVDGLDVVVTAEAGATVEIGSPVLVKNVAAGRHVLLRGLDVHVVSDDALRVETTAGTVWIEECALVTTLPPDRIGEGYDGIELSSCADVRVIRSTIAGGDGSDEWSAGIQMPGGAGMRAIDSTVRAYDSGFTGGDGGGATIKGHLDGKDGGDAIVLQGSRLVVWGCVLTGGDGGGADWCDCPGGLACGTPGDGGDGIAAELVPTAPSVELLGVTLVPGEAGINGHGPPCPYGVPGGWSSGLVPTDVVVHPGPHRRFWSESPAADGASALLHVQAFPGDLAVVAVQDATAPLAIPGFVGVLVLASPPTLLFTGPWSAALDPLAVPIPPQPAGFQSLRAFAQGAVVTPSGEVRLLAPASLVLIDDAF